MSAMTRLASRTFTAAAIGVSVVGLAAGVSAYAAPAAAPARAATCHIDWFTHPWEPGSFGAAITISTTRAFPNWLLAFGFTGSERVTSIPAGPIDWWYQAGRVVAVKGDSQLPTLPAGDQVLSLPLIIQGTPAGTPWFTLNGRACSVTATTAITPTTTTTTTQPPTTTTTTTTRSSSTTTTSSSYPNDSCSASYRILWQTATQFRAAVGFSGTSTLFYTNRMVWVFSGDQQVTELTPDTSAGTWAQTGPTVNVEGLFSSTGHSATFQASYSGENGPPLRVGSGFSCPISFYPAPSTTTTYASGS